MRKWVTIAILTVGMLSFGMLAATALAGASTGHNPGNPPNGTGGNPPSGPGNVCQPGYHGEPAGTNNCVHNGNGAGNCDQNQSENTGHGAGNGGNDYGNGHKPGCEQHNPPPPPQGKCPAGYSQDAGSTSGMLLCTRTITNTNTVTMLGPTQTKTVYGNPQCPSGTTETSRGQGYVVCEVPGPTQTIIKTKVVYGHPECPARFKQSRRGKGFVACTRTVVRNHVRTVIKVRVVKAPKPAYTK